MSDCMEQQAEAGWRDILLGRYAAMSLVLAGGISLHAINITISATMLPSIVAEIGGQKLYAWNSTLFTLSAILLAAVTGRVIQRLGARLTFVIAVLLFALGSLISAGSTSMTVMLAGRSVQGAGGGMLFTLCYAMIVHVYPEHLWSRAMALLSGTWGIAMLFGPAIGGIFAEYDAWRLGFLVLAPMAGVFLMIVLYLLPGMDRKKERASPIAYVQLAFIAGSVLAISFASLSPSLISAALWTVLSVVLIVALMRREQRGGNRLFPTGAMMPGTALFLTFALMALLIFCVNTEFFMPFYLQRLHGLSPLWAGYIAALVSIGWAVSEVCSARYEGKAMERAVVAGPLAMVAGMLILAAATPQYGSADLDLVLLIALALVLVGVGIGLGWPHINTFALQFMEAEERETAASALSTVQMFAVAFGTAVAGLVTNMSGFNQTDNIDGIANSAGWLFVTFAVSSVLACFVSWKLLVKRQEISQ